MIPPDHGPADELLSRGLRLLEETDAVPTLRWYVADRPAIVLGRGQAKVPINAQAGIDVVTRHSGGGAVLMDDTILSLDVVLPAGHPWVDANDLGRAFMHVGRAWAAALSLLGVTGVSVYDGPSLARRRGTPREQVLAAVCYATLGRGEIVVRDRKLVGLSQRRRRPGVLVQCGLLRRWSPGPLLAALGAEHLSDEIHEAAVGLDDLTNNPIPESDIRHAVEAAFLRSTTRQ